MSRGGNTRIRHKSFIKEENKKVYLFLFPARVLGPGSSGTTVGEEGGDVTGEDDVLDVSN